MTTNSPLKLKTILEPYNFRKPISSNFNWDPKSSVSLSCCYILLRQNFVVFSFKSEIFMSLQKQIFYEL